MIVIKKTAQYMEKRIIVLICVFFLSFLLFGYKNGMVVDKYVSQWRIENLFKNYRIFSTNFYVFLVNTISLHEADTESEWRSFYYLFPLFVFLKIFGGLNLQNLYFFNFLISVINLILFYKICEKYLDRQVAIIGTFFLAFSAWFFEFTMSMTYHAATITMALVLIYIMFKCLTKPSRINYILLGIVTVLSLYFYGVIRFLLPVVVILLFTKKEHFYGRFIDFLCGFLPLLILSFVLSRDNHIRLFDEENIFFIASGYDKPLFLRWYDNLSCCCKVLSGGTISLLHAHLINRLLFLPLVVGAVHIFCRLKIMPYKLLLIIAIAIILLPVFTTFAHWQERRYTLYAIPVYMFIGIGCLWIVERLSLIRKKKWRIILCFFLTVVLLYVTVFELSYTKHNIFSDKRDIGFVNLGQKINEFAIESPIFYLQESPQRFFEVDCEAYLLMLSVRNKIPDYKVIRISGVNNLKIQEEIYIVKSPFVSEDIFKNMIGDQNLFAEEILSTPAQGNFEYVDKTFRMYRVKNQ